MQRLNTELVKDRSRRVTKFFESYQLYDSLMDCELKVLVTDRSSDGKFYVGHDKCYRQVLVPQVEEYMGSWLLVKVEKTGKYFVMAKVLKVIGKKDMVGNVRMPKLVQSGKGLVKVDESANDGSELSPGNTKTQERIQSAPFNNLVGCLFIAIVAFGLHLVQIRFTLKLAILFFCIASVLKIIKN